LDTQASAHALKPGAGTRRYAVFLIGTGKRAVPVDAVERGVPVPVAELALGPAERSWAIGQWQGRKLPLVDISEGRQASDRQAAPWMVVVSHGPLVLGLTVSACTQFVELEHGAVARTPDEALLAGVALLTASALTRFGVLEAGLESARDPRYTIEPQKRRLAARRAAGITGDSITTAD